jgi:uncharacterized membrane protein YeaQ/YmgE (transglycosylase-associated protein family)
MTVASVLTFTLIGIIAGGWAGVILKGGGLGLVGNLAIGVLGALLVGLGLSHIDPSGLGFNASIVGASIGAILLIQIVCFMSHFFQARHSPMMDNQTPAHHR